MRDERDTLQDLEVPEELSIIVDELGVGEPAGYRDMPTTGRFVCEWRYRKDMGCAFAAVGVMSLMFVGGGVMSFLAMWVFDSEAAWSVPPGVVRELVRVTFPLIFAGIGVFLLWAVAETYLNRTCISFENGQLACRAVGPVAVHRRAKSFAIGEVVGFQFVPTSGVWGAVDALTTTGETIRVIERVPPDVVRYVFARLELLPLLEEEAKR